MINKKFLIVSLFSGVGGIEYGFEKTGYFETIWANEIDENAARTYKENFNHTLVVGDITKIDVKDIPSSDLLVAGFPCQAFSVAGYQKGFEDERGNLFFEIIRVIKEKKPRVVFLENVKNLVGHDNGNTFRVIREALEIHGYFVKKDVLNAKDYGNVPQNRERIYIIAFKNRSDYANYYDIETVPLTNTIVEMLDNEVPDEYYYTPDKTIIYDRLVDDIDEEGVAYQWRRKYVRKNKSGVFPTLTANMGTGGHNVPLVYQNKKIRKLTPRECFRVQGFDNSFKLPKNVVDSQLYKQAGNSVVVPVVRRIAERIYEALTK